MLCTVARGPYGVADEQMAIFKANREVLRHRG